MQTKTRSYNQYCPLARALDIIGERWTLLIVRELLTGPKRFKDLKDALLGLGTNLLSARLKEMEANGLIKRAKLPPPGVASVYELTVHGEQLYEAILAIVRWGVPLLAEPKKPDEYFMPHWLLHGMLSSFNKPAAQELSDTYEFHVDGEIFHITLANGEASGDMGKGHNPDLVWESSSADFMNFAFRLMPARQAHASGFIKKGDTTVTQRVLNLFDPVGEQ